MAETKPPVTAEPLSLTEPVGMPEQEVDEGSFSCDFQACATPFGGFNSQMLARTQVGSRRLECKTRMSHLHLIAVLVRLVASHDWAHVPLWAVHSGHSAQSVFHQRLLPQ